MHYVYVIFGYKGKMIEKIKYFFNSSTPKVWFLGSGGYLMSSSTCPCCGKPGCPLMFGIAALVGGVFTSFGLGIMKLMGWLKRKT